MASPTIAPVVAALDRQMLPVKKREIRKRIGAFTRGLKSSSI